MPKSTPSDYQPAEAVQKDSEKTSEAQYWIDQNQRDAITMRENGLEPAKVWPPLDDQNK